MSKAAELAALIGSQTALSNRNLIINGAMQVWQRSTSTTETGNGYASADRWSHNASGGTIVLSRQELTAGQTDIPSQFRYFFRLNATTGDNNAAIRQKIEDVTRVQGKHTVSFYAKGTNPAGGHLELEARQFFGTGGSANVSINNDVVLTSSWQRFIFTLDVASISGKTIVDTDSCFWLQFRQPADDTSTDAWTLDITGVQLEVGETATPFEHRSYGDELLRCQRYFVLVADGNDTGTFCNSHAWTTQEVIGHLDFGRVEMRANPTLSVSNNTHFQIRSGGISETSDNVSFAQADKKGNCRVEFSGSGGLTTGRGAWVKTLDANAYIHADAEL